MGKYVLSERAARALIPLIRGKAASTSPGYAPAAVSLDAFPAPFTVRWSQSEDNGSGAWVIWLPDIAKVVAFASTYITPSGVAAASELPAGWYTMSEVDANATAVYCAVTVTTSTGAATATITGTPATASTGQEVYNILVATMSTAATTGAKLVKQFVTSAITLGGAGDGGSITANGIVVMSVDYVTSSGDPDFASHAYAIRITRGRQSYNAATRQLTTVEDNNLKQFIDTVPLSSYFEP